MVASCCHWIHREFLPPSPPGAASCAYTHLRFTVTCRAVPHGIRIVLYFFGLIWSFMGVGIISDKFMLAIEVTRYCLDWTAKSLT